MKYICPRCKEEFEINKSGFILCPFCSNPIIKESDYLKIKDNLDNNRYTAEDLQELIKNESEIYKKIKGTPLENVLEYIEAMYNLLKDPFAQWQSKIVAMAALLYVINPADLIPDFIPVVGLIDDIAAVMIGVGVLGNALDKYKKESKKNKYSDNKIVTYKLKAQTTIDETNGTLKKNLVMWNIPPTKKNNLHMSLMSGKIIDGNELYVLNRSVGQHLVPLNNFDRNITDSIFKEAQVVLKSLGAKRITYTRKIATAVDKKAAQNIKYKNIFQGENCVDSKIIIVDKDEDESYFEQIDLVENLKNTKFIDKLLWYFTDNSIIDDTIFEERFIFGLNKRKLSKTVELGTILDVDSRANIKKYCTAAHKANISEFTKVHWDINVEYYSLTEIDKQHLKPIYELINRKIEKRREEVEQL